MKIIYYAFFLFCLIQTILSGTEDGYIITLESGIAIYGCENNILYFYFEAYTSGFEPNTRFDLKLHYPDYVVAECTVPEEKEGEKSIIYCGINVVNFPLLTEEKVYQLPSESEIISSISFEKWDEYISPNPYIQNTICIMTYNYIFKKNDEPFIVKIDEASGMRYLIGKGNFDGISEGIKPNYLTETDPISYFTTYIYVDTDFGSYDCEIYALDEAINSDDSNSEIHCHIPGVKKAVFFPTLASSKLEEDPGYILVNIYEEVNLSEENLSGTFSKLSALLLLSFLLL